MDKEMDIMDINMENKAINNMQNNIKESNNKESNNMNNNSSMGIDVLI